MQARFTWNFKKMLLYNFVTCLALRESNWFFAWNINSAWNLLSLPCISKKCLPHSAKANSWRRKRRFSQIRLKVVCASRSLTKIATTQQIRSSYPRSRYQRRHSGKLYGKFIKISNGARLQSVWQQRLEERTCTLIMDIADPEAQNQVFLLQCLPQQLWRLSGSKLCAIQHIRSRSHKICVNNSRFNNFILDLSRKYDGFNSSRKAKCKSHETTETHPNGFSHNDLDCELLGNPSKKVKKDGLQPYYMPGMNFFDPQIHYRPQFGMPFFGQSMTQQNLMHQSSFQIMPTMPHLAMASGPPLPPSLTTTAASVQPSNVNLGTQMGCYMENPMFCWGMYNFNLSGNMPNKKS